MTSNLMDRLYELRNACDKCAALMNHINATTGWHVKIGADSAKEAHELSVLISDARNALRNAGFEIK